MTVMLLSATYIVLSNFRIPPFSKYSTIPILVAKMAVEER